MKCRLLIVVLLLLGAAPGARAQEGLDRISELRLRIESMVEAGRELAAQRDRVQAQLRALGLRIEKLQAHDDRQRLLPEFELEGLLRRSQELSRRLRELNRGLAALEQARFRQLEQLAAALRGQIARELEQARHRAGEADLRRQRLLSLRRQLEVVDRQLARPETPLPELPASEQLLAGADSERLAQYAEALQDERDRLRRRLARLDERLTRARAQARLDQQMRDFLADQDLFGEREHTLQATRAKTVAADDERQGGSDSGFSYDQGAPAGNPGECSGGLCGTPVEAGGGLDADGAATASGRLPVAPEQSPGSAAVAGTPVSLTDMQRRRDRLVRRLKQIQILYDRIMERLETLPTDAVR